MAMPSDEMLLDLRNEFAKLEIELSDTAFISYTMPASRTNKYVQVKALDGTIYIVRINGKLWPPGDREHEANNLQLLGEQNIETNVLSNCKKEGFQICRFTPEEKRFSMITDEQMKMDCLKKVAESIKTYQESVNFENVLSVRDLVVKAFNDLRGEKKEKLKKYYDIVMHVIFVLEQDGKSKASSHNDLATSSIYYITGQIIIVDWEYSARNHPYYDLAHLSVMSSLTLEEDQAFLTSYDGSIRNFSIEHGYSFILMKVIVNFVKLAWNWNQTIEGQLWENLRNSLQHVFGYALHENSSLSELISLVELESAIDKLLQPFIFQQHPIPNTTNSCLFESIQKIMDHGQDHSQQISECNSKFCQTIRDTYSVENVLIGEQTLEEYWESIKTGKGCWHNALGHLATMLSIRFFVYEKRDGVVSPQPKEFGNTQPYLQLCAYLLFNYDTEQYEPLCLVKSEDKYTIVKTRFLVNGRFNKLLETFVCDTNSAADQIPTQASGTISTATETTVSMVEDQSVDQLRPYVNRLRAWRQTQSSEIGHNLDRDMRDPSITMNDVCAALIKELDYFLLLVTESIPPERPSTIDESTIDVSIDEANPSGRVQTVSNAASSAFKTTESPSISQPTTSNIYPAGSKQEKSVGIDEKPASV